MLKSFTTTTVSGVRTTLVQQTRWIQVSARAFNVKEDAGAAPKAKRTVVSSVPEGSALKGLNYMKDGKDPLALADSAYPEWLWDIVDPEVRAARVADPLDKKHHKEARRQRIKAENFIRDKKT
ncbi:39S ribosomal protein L37, mitochondrial [Dissophora globulifera]|uniref:Large ribosomal subunit protein mL54 n=1 Tax=Dissophora globulifera TaxID=979702 RepID=A0A9P6RP51_9FUNG|nr:39S ribosomal protein L37, mitochondrial [Dissophora globulifera]KAG0324340.1 39S ribosomal protein L37, mitochondrial [Dissophora globulifera]